MSKIREMSADHRDEFLAREQKLREWSVRISARDRSMADDLFQDLFIVFTVNQPNLKRIENLDSYLYKSLRNLHISQLRRSSLRVAYQEASVLDYASAKLSLMQNRGCDQIHAKEQLLRICSFVCHRKQLANSASVMLLRFFLGYYPTEIAPIMSTSRSAVDERLRIARIEARAFLRSDSQPADLPNLDGSEMDFLFELRTQIFESRHGSCPSFSEFQRWYCQDIPKPLTRKQLAHIVSCPVCLDRANRIHGLPELKDRYPTDTIDRDMVKTGAVQMRRALAATECPGS